MSEWKERDEVDPFFYDPEGEREFMYDNNYWKEEQEDEEENA